jgi:hypothetical protein
MGGVLPRPVPAPVASERRPVRIRIDRLRPARALLVLGLLFGVLAGAVFLVRQAIIGSMGRQIHADTPCQDYLRASQTERRQAVRRIGAVANPRGAANPLARANVDYECGQSPDRPLGQVIAAQSP